ncbi:MAG TPA: UvrD-helicase domain-containing protein [Steroidobacteraceae bacterium]|nr:UvrD-helicase domain-containing protein [Steroidobacteraceae bacterium]
MSDARERLDDAARREATDPAASILLEAPAGSGKTAVLTQRFLRLLAAVDDPGEILAITFTRKAAAEMRARVIRALRAELPADDPGAALLAPLAAAARTHGAARGWRLDAEPERLRIQTIDSFNYWLASQLPVASRAGGALNITESAAELYRRAARRTLLAADSDPALAPDAQLLFERLDNHWLNLERLIAQMLEQRGHWLRFVAAGDADSLCRRVNESLTAETRVLLARLRALLPEGLRRRAESLPGAGPLGAAPADLDHWKHFAHLVLTRNDWRKQLSAHRLRPGFTEAAVRAHLKDLIDDLRHAPGLREALLELRRAPAAQLSAPDAAALAALARMLSRAAAELHAACAEVQRVDYTYITGAARQALAEGGDPTDLALRTGLALRHILVDEFQDTSLAQVQLLEALTIGWEPGDGRTLFVVGDPMQSIYRFRDAEVGLFLRARAAGIGRVPLRPLRLLRNFRAERALVEFTNELFAQVFPAADDLRAGGVSYRDSLPTRAGAGELAGIEPVTLRLYAADPAAEARAVAARVAELRRLDPEGTVGILVVAHAHAVAVIAALEARGLAPLGVDLVPLRERLVVRDLVQLTRALHDLADRSAWLAVLRAPWCGARLATLTALSAASDRELVIEALANPERLTRCDPADRLHLERLRDVLGRALTGRGARPLASWLEATWLRLGAADAYSRHELRDARAFFAALAERTAAFGWRGPEELEPLLERLYSAPAAGDNPVQVMTIHRAKGLEFDHVFVPALDRTTRAPERRLLRWLDLPSATSDSNLLIAPAPVVGAHEEEGDLNAWLKDLIRQHDAHERARVMYVAATRARRSLWLSGAAAPGADGVVRPDRRSALHVLWGALAPRFEAVAGTGTPAAAIARSGPLMRLLPSWRAAEPPPRLALEQLPGAYLAAEPTEFSWVGETQRHIGTVVHAWLARLSRQAPLPPAAAIVGECDAVLAALTRAGVPERERSAAGAAVLAALGQTLADERGRWILDSAHAQAHSEWELSGVGGGVLRSVVVDRSFVDARGTRWVIDYKTSAHEGGGLEEFLDTELERYRAQLDGYRELARGLGPEPVRAALYFPLLGAFRELG